MGCFCFLRHQLHYHNLEWKTNGAVDFLKTCSTEKPFFLYLGTTALHGPSHAESLKHNPHYTPGGKLESPFAYHPPRETIFERLNELGHDINHFTAGIKYLAFRYPEEVQYQIQQGEINITNHLNRPGQSHASITLMYYPEYFAPDQLYNLQNDPYEQVNLASDPEHSETLKEMRQIMNHYTQSIGSVFPLEDTGFANTQAYKKLVERSVNIDSMPGWWPKDFYWPPANKKEEAKLMIREY